MYALPICSEVCMLMRSRKAWQMCRLNVQALGVNYVSSCCPKPVMSTTKLKKPLYLVGVSKFTNFSGNEVPLVVLHINGVKVVLKSKKESVNTHFKL